MVARCDQSSPARRVRVALAALFAAAFAVAVLIPSAASAATRFGELDCNGQSPIQHALRMSMACTDIRGFNNVWNKNTWNGRFYDNNQYIGHDEPDMTFLSSKQGSGNNVTWTETLPQDPSALPTDTNPGHDVAHWFELSPAPWFSMAICDPNSYPQQACAPQSDSNAPTSTYYGGGSAFMEMQFYPPGNPPFLDAPSCNDTHWCSALTIDSLECTNNFAYCNPNCTEPVNFAFIQQNGIPAGPPAPDQADLATFTPNSQTLMYNPGDTIRVHMYDATVPGGGGAKAFEVVINDLTTGQSGYMQASAQNGFGNSSIGDCSTTPFNFQPEYNTAAKQNIVPWAALATNISTEYETGHWIPCQSIGQDQYPNGFGTYAGDPFWNSCTGPYESAANPTYPESNEVGEAFCFPAGDTHPAIGGSAPDLATGCQDNVFQNGDLDFDGTEYYPEWPTGTSPTATLPSSFVQQLPTSGGGGYSRFFIQTDVALSESTCSGTTTTGCSVPPNGPGGFYPYWTRVSTPKGCSIEFGNVSSTGNNYGQDAQYGTDQIATLGYPEFEGPVMQNSCSQRGKS
jgi:hypothetical protein